MSDKTTKLTYFGCFLGCLHFCLTQAKDTKSVKSAKSTFARDIFIDDIFAKDTFI